MSTAETRSAELIEANDLAKNGQIKKAAEILKSFLKKDSLKPAECLEAYTHLIRICFELQKFDDVEGYIEEIKGIELDGREAKIQFARCLYSTGTLWFHNEKNIQKAKELYRRGRDIASEENDAELLFACEYMLTVIKRSSGKLIDAHEEIEQLRELAKKTESESNLANVLLLEGNILRKKGRYPEAIEKLEGAREILQSNRNSYNYHYNLWALGTCYAAIENRVQAEIYLGLSSNETQNASEFKRINILSKLTLAELYTVTGDFDKSAKAFDDAESLAGSDISSYFGRRIARAKTLFYIRKGSFEKANNLIDELVIQAVKEKNQRDLMRLRLLKAEVLLRTGEADQHDEARAMLQEALAHYQERNVGRHQAVCLELLARLDSRSGFPSDSIKKIEVLGAISKEATFDRFQLRAKLAELVLKRKLGHTITQEEINTLRPMIDKLNARAERVILSRFNSESYDAWSTELELLGEHGMRFVNEFFEDFHFVPTQSIDIEIDRNSHYVREKHLGEIPFHNKFTLMRILLLLAEAPGREFSKEELANKIWEQEYNPLRHDNNIYININRLRKLIEPNPRESRYIMNGPRGYYFNPSMKVNISTRISDVAPRLQSTTRTIEGNL